MCGGPDVGCMSPHMYVVWGSGRDVWGVEKEAGHCDRVLSP